MMSAADLKFDSESFECVLDKATMDSIDPKRSYKDAEILRNIRREVERVLVGGGVLLLVTAHPMEAISTAFAEDTTLAFHGVCEVSNHRVLVFQKQM